MNKIKITITIQAYNVEKYIGEAIKSILNQTESKWELFIRNNGSTDQTGAICKEYASQDDRIKYFENKVNGVTDNNEPWFPDYNGEYYACLDGDDFLEPDFFRIMYDNAKKYNADMVVCGASMFIDETGEEVGKRIPKACVINEENPINEELFMKLYNSLRPLWAKLFRNDDKKGGVYNKAIPPKELKNARDTFYVLSYLQHCKTVVGIDKALYNYRIRNGSLFHSKMVEIERVNEGDVLFWKGKETAQKLNIFSDNILTFLCNIHYGHMMDLKSLCLESNTMTKEQKIRLLEEIISNRLFGTYITKGEGYLNVLEWLTDSIIYIVGELENDEEGLAESYLVRLCDLWINREKRAGLETFILLMSVILDKNNKNYFGREILISNKVWIPRKVQEYIKDNIELKELVNKCVECLIDYEGECINKKQEILRYIDEKEYLLAHDMTKEILEEKTLDREALYFDMYLNAVQGNVEGAMISSQLAIIFYDTDDEIVALHNEIVGML